MNSDRKVGSVGVFSVKLLNDYMGSNQFRKVVHSKSGENLLENVLRLFSMKIKKSNCVLEFSEGSFNPPAHSIKLL